MTIAIIPARGGSKRVPRKNIKLLNGKPLIHYTIETALQCNLIDKVIVSTDEDEIAEISKQINGVEVVKRSSSLSNDSAKSIDVIKHVIKKYNNKGFFFENVVLLQPTCPFRKLETLYRAIDILLNQNCDSVISHTRLLYPHPNRVKTIDSNKNISPYCEAELENVSQKDLPLAYYRDGSIYATKTEVILNENSFFGKKQKAVILEEENAINIDTESDWYYAEYYAKKMY